MWGIAARHLLKHFKTGMLLIAVTIALALIWSYDLMRLEPTDILTSPVFSLSAIDELAGRPAA